MTYRIDYSDPNPGDDGVVIEGENYAPVYRYANPPKRGFRVPSIVKTATTFLTAGAVFFAVESYAPVQFRPSTIMGTYDARVASAVKGAELQQQAKFEGWAATVKIASAQHEQEYKAATEGVLQNFSAAYDQNKVVKSALMQLQNSFVQQRMGQVIAQQQTDTSIINFTRLFGRIANGIEDGAGDTSLQYADGLSSELAKELLNATLAGVQVDLRGADTTLPTPDQVRSELGKIKPFELPPVPDLGEQGAYLPETK